MTKEVLLISPPTTTHRTPEENLGLEYVATESENAGHKVIYIDAWMGQNTHDQVLAQISKSEPEIIGLSPSMDSINETLDICRSLRKNGYVGQIVLGGVYASFEADYLLIAEQGLIDGVFIGDADISFQEYLIQGLQAGIAGTAYQNQNSLIHHKRTSDLIDLDSLPIPNRPTLELTKQWKTPAHIMGSRGCYGNCSFCSVACYQQFSSTKRWRGRSPQSILEEVQSLHSMGVDMVKFVDDNFFGPGNKERERELARLITEANMSMKFRLSLRVNDVDDETIKTLKNAGLFAVSLGVESFVPRKLRDYTKGTHVSQNIAAVKTLERNGVFVQMGHIMFDPFTTLDEIEQELDGLKQTRWAVTKGICTRLFAADGTPITEAIRQEVGFYDKEGANNLYRFVDPAVTAYYHALRIWAQETNKVYDQVIDPISAPKNIDHNYMYQFHGLCCQLKDLDLEVAVRLLIAARKGAYSSLDKIVAQFIAESEEKRGIISQQAINLYRESGLLDYLHISNKRL